MWLNSYEEIHKKVDDDGSQYELFTSFGHQKHQDCKIESARRGGGPGGGARGGAWCWGGGRPSGQTWSQSQRMSGSVLGAYGEVPVSPADSFYPQGYYHHATAASNMPPYMHHLHAQQGRNTCPGKPLIGGSAAVSLSAISEGPCGRLALQQL
ncbi:hypothetical protein J6590_057157 [Homalodisca vitripennis]|nr:hypothetical protein J6590_057157 [Homalodisca vitripennis]